MKGMNLFSCSSTTSTAVTNHQSTTIVRRIPNPRKTHLPCSTPELPITPKPKHDPNNHITKQKSMKRSEKYYDKQSDHDSLRRKSCADISELRKKSSSEYLLSDKPFVDDKYSKGLVRSSDSPVFNSSSSDDQVVILRVSIHCKACEGKLRKHISKIEGVRSFEIELETKKVTVIGDITPLRVLASVSKVKNAQLWPSNSTLSSSKSVHSYFTNNPKLLLP